MKKVLLKLSLASLFVFTVSCGQLDIVSISSKASRLAKLQQVEKEANTIILHNKNLNRKLGQSYANVITSVARASNPFELARWVLDPNTSLTDLFRWSDSLLESIHQINTPVANQKVAEIQAIRDAEPDPEIRKRYDAILARMQQERNTVNVNTRGLRKQIQRGIYNVEKAQKWMIGGNAYVAAFFLLFGSNMYGKIIDIDIALNYLDENLKQIENNQFRSAI